MYSNNHYNTTGAIAMAPLQDFTASALSMQNVPKSRKQQYTPLSQQQASSRKFAHNPYAEVLPTSVEEMVRVLEYRRVQQLSSQGLRRSMSNPNIAGPYSTPQSPLQAFPRTTSMPVFFDEPESPVMPNQKPSTPTPSNDSTEIRREDSNSALNTSTGSATANSSTSVLTKVYQNGRPVPRMRTEEGSSPVQPAAPAEMPKRVPTPPPTTRTFAADSNACVRIAFRRNTALFKARPGMELTLGTFVIVDGDRGVDLGVVESFVEENECGDEKAVGEIQRNARDSELEKLDALAEDDEKALEAARSHASRHLSGKISIEYACFQFDKEKLTIWYKSPERVYFVPLLKALNQQFKCRIWMERIEE